MSEILASFGTAFTASAVWALPAAFAWGMVSVLLSPCHLSGVPLVVAYMNGAGAFPDNRRAVDFASRQALLASLRTQIPDDPGVCLNTGQEGNDVVNLTRISP